MEDKRLLRLLERDPNAGMEQLMKQYTGLVYAVVKSRLWEPDVEDCVAEVFVSFYEALPRFDPSRASVKTYLCVLAKNRAINLAGRQRETVPLDDAELESEQPDEVFRREVLRAVAALGKPDSEILFRKYYYGESSKEIAAAMRMSVSNVDTRTHRALNKLRKQFGGKEN